ncbi:MAG: helix-turn-helix domain-containing protein [Chloroflexi bacterium]|nr:helix-turn-helix domain-containing protein [Chloroflexota bacterium]
MPDPTDQQLLLRMDAAAERLAVSRATLYRLIGRGELEVVHIGTAVRVPASALERWVSARLGRSEPYA